MSILQDVRLAFRLFRRNLVATGIALLSIALSVAATAVVFAAIKSVLIDLLPYARAERLVQIRSEFPKVQEQPKQRLGVLERHTGADPENAHTTHQS